MHLMTPKHVFWCESYDFQAVFFLDPYELCGVEWLTSSVGMDIPKACGEGRAATFPTALQELIGYQVSRLVLTIAVVPGVDHCLPTVD